MNVWKDEIQAISYFNGKLYTKSYVERRHVSPFWRLKQLFCLLSLSLGQKCAFEIVKNITALGQYLLAPVSI